MFGKTGFGKNNDGDAATEASGENMGDKIADKVDSISETLGEIADVAEGEVVEDTGAEVDVRNAALGVAEGNDPQDTEEFASGLRQVASSVADRIADAGDASTDADADAGNAAEAARVATEGEVVEDTGNEVTVIMVDGVAYTAEDIRAGIAQTDELVAQVTDIERFDDLHVRYRSFVNKGVILDDDSVRERILLAATGLGGEAGEVIDILKKYAFHGAVIDAKDITLEMGDMFWYFTLLADTLGISLSQIIDRNMEKLRNRYPEIHNV